MFIYQVYPRSFQDSNGDGVGDLRGIASRLSYLQALGVEMLWIGPFFRSPMRDFGYDVSDFRAVDPCFGTLADFTELLADAKSRGIGVMVDMVVSHTSDQHRWFDASRRREGGPGGKADWYLWADAKPDGTPPNNWMSVFGGSAWEWDARRRQYYFHSFLASQPDLNFHHPAVQQQVLDDMRWWLELGVAGFRLDACNHYFQDARLRDNPPAADSAGALHPYGFQHHVHDKNRPEVPAFLARVRALLDAYGAYSVAEVGGADGARLALDYVAPGRLHSAYNFDLLRKPSSAAYIAAVLQAIEDGHIGRADDAIVIGGERSVGEGDPAAGTGDPLAAGVPCHALSNHDKPRVATRWVEGHAAREALAPGEFARQMLALLACLNGTVCLYQGEELGLPEAEVPREHLQDPFGQRFWPAFKGRDGCRTPMPWTDEAPHAGFLPRGSDSAVAPWLPIPPEHLALNVAAQERDADSVLAFARRVFALRRARPELDRGALSAITAEGELLSFERSFGGAVLHCAFNLGAAPCALPAQDTAAVLLARHASRGPAGHRLEAGGLLVCERVARSARAD